MEVEDITTIAYNFLKQVSYLNVKWQDSTCLLKEGRHCTAHFKESNGHSIYLTCPKLPPSILYLLRSCQYEWQRSYCILYCHRSLPLNTIPPPLPTGHLPPIYRHIVCHLITFSITCDLIFEALFKYFHKEMMQSF